MFPTDDDIVPPVDVETTEQLIQTSEERLHAELPLRIVDAFFGTVCFESDIAEDIIHEVFKEQNMQPAEQLRLLSYMLELATEQLGGPARRTRVSAVTDSSSVAT